MCEQKSHSLAVMYLTEFLYLLFGSWLPVPESIFPEQKKASCFTHNIMHLFYHSGSINDIHRETPIFFLSKQSNDIMAKKATEPKSSWLNKDWNLSIKLFSLWSIKMPIVITKNLNGCWPKIVKLLWGLGMYK